MRLPVESTGLIGSQVQFRRLFVVHNQSFPFDLSDSLLVFDQSNAQRMPQMPRHSRQHGLSTSQTSAKIHEPKSYVLWKNFS